MIDGSKRSTKANAFFSGLGSKKKLTMLSSIKPKFDGFNLGNFKLPGGYLESKWLGLGLDKAATQLFTKLQSGGVLMGFVGNMLAKAYRPMRFGIINKLTSLLYLILIKILTYYRIACYYLIIFIISGMQNLTTIYSI